MPQIRSSSSGSGGLAVPQDLEFGGANLAACQAARDAFFTANPSRRNDRVNVLLKPSGAAVVLQQWDGAGTSWRDVTAVVRGPVGDAASNLVQSVAGKTGSVVLDKSDVGLSSVDNTADANKPVSGPQAAALALKIDVAEKGQPNGVASLDAAGKIPAGQVPAPVSSVAGKTGVVVLNKNDVGLPNVDNTADSAKPVSTAVQLALDDKISSNLRGAPNGVASLDAGGRVPSAQLPTSVTSVAGKTGTVTLSKSDVQLGQVDNVADLDKPISNATASALTLKLDLSQKGAANGVAPLGSDSKIPSSYLGAVATGETFVVGNQTARLALNTAKKGDVAVQSDNQTSYILQAEPPSLPGNWVQLLFPAAVTSVNGQTGTVTLSAASVGALGTAAYTAKGALVAGSGAGSAGTLAAGTDGQYLVVDAASPQGVKWATLPSAATVVNDLTTGGVAASLSAEQGKVLKAAVDAKAAVGATAAAALAATASAGASAEAARADHVHPRPTALSIGAVPLSVYGAKGDLVIGKAAAGQVSTLTVGADGTFLQADSTALDGVKWAAGLSLSSTAPAALGTAAVGVGTTAARADHVHAPPAAATTSAAGLMSAADKTKLDGISVATVAPLNDGVAAVGTSSKYAREDHVHPGSHAIRLVSNTNEFATLAEMVTLDVNLPAATVNTSSAFFERTSDGRVKVLRKGVYLISGSASCSVFNNAGTALTNPTNQGRWTVFVHNYTGDVTVGSGTGRFVTSTNDITNANVTGILQLNANDIVGLRCWGNPGTGLKMKLNHVVGFVCDLNVVLIQTN